MQERSRALGPAENGSTVSSGALHSASAGLQSRSAAGPLCLVFTGHVHFANGRTTGACGPPAAAPRPRAGWGPAEASAVSPASAPAPHTPLGCGLCVSWKVPCTAVWL